MRIRKSVIVLLLCAAFSARAQMTDAALRWLAYHQEMDGHWDSLKYGAKTKSDTITSSLALLAFLGAGQTEKLGEFKENVRRAATWLRSKQAESGRVGDPTDIDEATTHALGTWALCEATAMAKRPETLAAAQRAVDYCTDVYPCKAVVDAAGVKTYSLDESADTVIIGWNIAALKSAKNAGLKVPHETFEVLIAYVDSVEHKIGQPQKDGRSASEYWCLPKDKNSTETPPYQLCAIGCLCRQFTGWRREDLELSVEHLVGMSWPNWKPGDTNPDFLYWYIGRLCTFQQGGEVWQKWNKALTSALLENQSTDGDNVGSWEAIGFAGMKWGRAGQTALGCLCTEVYFAYRLKE